MYTGDVLSCTSHSGTVRHTCPIKNGEGDGLFFTVRKDKTLYKPTRWRSEALGEIPEGITRPIKGSEKERQETDALTNPFHREFHTVFHHRQLSVISFRMYSLCSSTFCF